MTGLVFRNFRIWNVGTRAYKETTEHQVLGACAGESTIAAATRRLVLRGHTWKSQKNATGQVGQVALEFPQIEAIFPLFLDDGSRCNPRAENADRAVLVELT